MNTPMNSQASGRFELDKVWLALDGDVLVAPFSLSIDPGEIVTVMGASGCGKSSLLAYICGFLDPAFTAGGNITLDNSDVTHLPPEKRCFGILFQDDLLFPHMSVGENLAFGLVASVHEQRERRQTVEDALNSAQLEGFADRDPATLSGGQRARVALLRTLLARPRALLLDEPFSKLDARLKNRFRTQVFEHARAKSLPTLLVTHDPADADAAGGRTIEIQTAGDHRSTQGQEPT